MEYNVINNIRKAMTERVNQYEANRERNIWWKFLMLNLIENHS
jgi:hypothetical protein